MYFINQYFCLVVKRCWYFEYPEKRYINVTNYLLENKTINLKQNACSFFFLTRLFKLYFYCYE